MPISTASVATDRPARYAKQLTSHLSRRLATSWDEDTGRGVVELGDGRAELTAVDGALDMRIDSTDLSSFEDVIGRHLVRFGKKDELVVQWTREDGTPGTSYRNDADETIGEH
ncbi:MAG TPA: DUF2218 domain-containing protein [Jatrophihabitans sp.]|jgi:hypothetical protein